MVFMGRKNVYVLIKYFFLAYIGKRITTGEENKGTSPLIKNVIIKFITSSLKSGTPEIRPNNRREHAMIKIIHDKIADNNKALRERP